MAEVKWIKICTDIFDDEKILLIESYPEADAVITIWFKLLCLAGKQNNDGVFRMNDRIHYTEEMFSTIFRRPINTVRMALGLFEEFGMIERINDVVTIPNWNKHQSLDAYEAKKERDRLYQAERRLKQKAIAEKSSDSRTIQSCDIEKNRFVEEDKKKIRIEEDIDKSKEVRHSRSEYGWVKLTDEELERMRSEWGDQETARCIDYVDEAAQRTGNKNKWKDWNLVVRKCHREQWGVRQENRTAQMLHDSYDMMDRWANG